MKKLYKILICVISFLCLPIAATEDKAKEPIPAQFTVRFGNFEGVYNVVNPKGTDGVKIVYIPDFSDNSDMGEEAAKALFQKLVVADQIEKIEAVVLPGDKANMLGTLLHGKISKFRESSQYGSTQFVILRSAEKGMVEHSVQYSSITGGNKTLNIRLDQVERIQGKTVLLFDDVLSTGGTLKAARDLIANYNCKVLAYACVAVEGDERKDFEGLPLYSLTHLPVWVTSDQTK